MAYDIMPSSFRGYTQRATARGWTPNGPRTYGGYLRDYDEERVRFAMSRREPRQRGQQPINGVADP